MNYFENKMMCYNQMLKVYQIYFHYVEVKKNKIIKESDIILVKIQLLIGEIYCYTGCSELPYFLYNLI